MKIFVMQKKMGGETSRWLYVLGSRMSFFPEVSKCLGDIMSGWQNVSATQCPGGKMSRLQNVRVSKCLSVKMSKCQNVEVLKWVVCKMSGAEMSENPSGAGKNNTV